jgi:hypothetical protein
MKAKKAITGQILSEIQTVASQRMAVLTWMKTHPHGFKVNAVFIKQLKPENKSFDASPPCTGIYIKGRKDKKA